MQARTAISLRNERRQEARLGQALDKSGRIFRLAVEVAPIFAGKVGAERTNGAADLRKFVVLLIGERLHAISPPIRQERRRLRAAPSSRPDRKSTRLNSSH